MSTEKKQQTILALQKSVLQWYRRFRRDLPWRHTRNPYHILVSEIMLQQTQVNRVLPKYAEFLHAFPTLQTLASATSGDVIRVWAGLGYNRRALFLQRTVQAVVRDFGGVFPDDIDVLKTLPGIGDYTARAILSFAFERPVPMIDTNHRRFYQRVFFGMRIKNDAELLTAAEQVLPGRRAYDWNQALMDFGSLVCLSGTPRCGDCPLQRYCAAYPEVLAVRKITKKQKNKPTQDGKTIPFRETDRYIRGRIVDKMRQVPTVSISAIVQSLSDYDETRVKRIVDDLVRDGLLVKKRNFLQLP